MIFSLHCVAFDSRSGGILSRWRQRRGQASDTIFKFTCPIGRRQRGRRCGRFCSRSFCRCNLMQAPDVSNQAAKQAAQIEQQVSCTIRGPREFFHTPTAAAPMLYVVMLSPGESVCGSASQQVDRSVGFASGQWQVHGQLERGRRRRRRMERDGRPFGRRSRRSMSSRTFGLVRSCVGVYVHVLFLSGGGRGGI